MAGEHSGNCEVSGGTSGIGKATALAFAAAGAKVVSTGRCEKEGTHELLIRKWSTASWAKKATDKLRIINIA
jgi:NAD(P)-dependent dehydrogenase (short-subunit alcohol dehydrogenase family)